MRIRRKVKIQINIFNLKRIIKDYVQKNYEDEKVRKEQMKII